MLAVPIKSLLALNQNHVIKIVGMLNQTRWVTVNVFAILHFSRIFEKNLNCVLARHFMKSCFSKTYFLHANASSINSMPGIRLKMSCVRFRSTIEIIAVCRLVNSFQGSIYFKDSLITKNFYDYIKNHHFRSLRTAAGSSTWLWRLSGIGSPVGTWDDSNKFKGLQRKKRCNKPEWRVFKSI